MINKDRIVPITRTDLLSFFMTINNALSGPEINILQASDGAITLPDGASGAYLAAEPLKILPAASDRVMLYFVPSYDFEMTMTPVGDAPEFVPNPGNLCYMVGNKVTQFDTKAEYTVA